MLTTLVFPPESSQSVPKADANGLGSRLLLPSLFTRKSSIVTASCPCPSQQAGGTPAAAAPSHQGDVPVKIRSPGSIGRSVALTARACTRKAARGTLRDLAERLRVCVV